MCFKAIFYGQVETSLDFFDAVEVCRVQNLTLAFPRTEDDVAAMNREFFKSIKNSTTQKYPWVWIGLRNTKDIRIPTDLYGIPHNYIKPIRGYSNRPGGMLNSI